MFATIKKDFERYYSIEVGSKNPGLIRKNRLLLQTPGIHALIIYRFGKWLTKDGGASGILQLFKPVYLLLNFFIEKLYDIRISQDANIAPGFYVGHFAGIEIGLCTIGKNCSVHQHVKICPDKSAGSSTQKTLQIGCNVWIGSHSIIDCDLQITDGVTIAAGSVVTNDIETPSMVMGNPARIVKANYDNSGLL